MDKPLTIKVTCRECTRSFQTTVPKQSWDDYQNGMVVDIAFYYVSENAKRLIVDKLCPTCYVEMENKNG